MKGRIQKLGNRLLSLALLAALLLTLVPTPARATNANLLQNITASANATTGTTTSMTTFSDVPQEHVFYSHISDAARLGLVHGYSDGTFRPANTLSRRNVVRILANMAGLPVDKTDEDACRLVQRISGINVRDLSNPASRDFITSLLYSVALNAGATAASPETCVFPDCQSLPGENRSAIGWCYQNQIINGYANGNFAPNGFLSRGAATKIFYNFYVLATGQTPIDDGNGNSSLNLNEALELCHSHGLYAVTEGDSLLVFTGSGRYEFVRSTDGNWQTKVGSSFENISVDGVKKWIDDESAKATTAQKLQVASDRLSRLARDLGLTIEISSVNNNSFTFSVNGSSRLNGTVSINSDGALVTSVGSLRNLIEALEDYAASNQDGGRTQDSGRADSGDSGNTSESNEGAPMTVSEAVTYCHEYGLFAVVDGNSLYAHTGEGRYDFKRSGNQWQVKSGNRFEDISNNGVRNWIATQSAAMTTGEKLRVAQKELARFGNELGLTSEVASAGNSAFTFTVIGNARLNRTISIDRNGALTTDGGSLQSYLAALEEYAGNRSFKDQLDEQVDHFVSEAERLGWQVEQSVTRDTAREYSVSVSAVGTHWTYGYTVTATSSDPVPVWDNGGTAISFTKVISALNNAQ